MNAKASRRGVQPHQLLVDIGLTKTMLRGALEALDYCNLDDLPELPGVNTITGRTTLHIHTKPAAPAATAHRARADARAGRHCCRR